MGTYEDKSGVRDGGGKEEENVLESIGAEQEEDMVSRGIEQFQQEGLTLPFQLMLRRRLLKIAG